MEEVGGGPGTRSSCQSSSDVSGGEHVRISKVNMLFAKAAEQKFRVTKVINRRPRAVYKLEDLNDTPIEGHFFREKLTPVRITDRTSYKIDKILDKRVKRGIREYLVPWRGYSQDFDSWVPVASVNYI